MQDEAYAFRKGVYPRRLHVHGIALQDHRVRPELDGEGFFQRYDSFTGKEFVEFLKAACERFKILMISK